MTYVIDANILIDIEKHYYRDVFLSFWKRFEQMISEDRIVSVKECERELQSYSNETYIVKYLKSVKKDFFSKPDELESRYLLQIFERQHHQQSIRTRQISLGKPVADPFLVAKAKRLKATVLSNEISKPNSAQIPQICAALNVEIINFHDFLLENDFRF